VEGRPVNLAELVGECWRQLASGQQTGLFHVSIYEQLRAQRPMPLAVGEDTYQEFTAGTIPVRRVMAEDPVSLVLVEHERGFMPVFDEHLGAVRRGEVATENVDYVTTWTGMTGDATRPTVIRLELRIDGLRARPRLLFTGHAMTPLWLLADGAWLGLVLHPSGDGPTSSLVGIWVLGPTPARGGLRRVLTQAGVSRPATLPRPPSRRRRSSPRARKRAPGDGKSRARARQRRQRDATRPGIEKQN
jgi:hypothetical protein